MKNPTDDLAANSGSSGVVYSYQVKVCAEGGACTGNLPSVPLTATVPGSGVVVGGVSCTAQGFAKTMFYNWDWANGGKFVQTYNDAQVFAAGQTRAYTLGWTIPDGVAPGAYTVHIGIFSPGWGTVYHWNAGAGSLTVTDGTPPPNAGAPKVMPLGDSLTDGYYTPGGYRPDLAELLGQDGLLVDYVGSLANGPAGFRDQEHEGHSGWRIALA